MNEQLALDQVKIQHGRANIVDEVSFKLAEGEIGCLLGPSGSGKTTILRAIAGFKKLSGGSISLRGQVISTRSYSQAPEKRAVGMVFQDLALFPHLDVSDNIGFGLHQVGSDNRADRVNEVLRLVGLKKVSKRYPHELSIGQQQRVAFARAIAPNPKILLLDEPFSSLDNEYRSNLIDELKVLLKEKNVTTLLVTHDQNEAFAMGDQVILLSQGEIVQIGPSNELYQNPANPFVAEFLGLGNLVSLEIDSSGKLSADLGSIPRNLRKPNEAGEIKLLIRPNSVIYDVEGSHELRIVSKGFRDTGNWYKLAIADGQTLICNTPHFVDLEPGEHLPVRFCLEDAVVFGNH